MFEKTGMWHPDKCADRIAGALVDYCYDQQRDPRCAWEVQIGHGLVTIIGETSVKVPYEEAVAIVERIIGRQEQIILRQVDQDPHLADNQKNGFKCGDNGVMKGMPVTPEQKELTALMHTLAHRFPGTDAKAVLDIEHGTLNIEHSASRLIVCQSQATEEDVRECIGEFMAHNVQCSMFNQ